MQLKIRAFKCQMSAITRKSTCGADAVGQFNRADFGIDIGQSLGFDMTVRLAIQVEAVAVE